MDLYDTICTLELANKTEGYSDKSESSDTEPWLPGQTSRFRDREGRPTGGKTVKMQVSTNLTVLLEHTLNINMKSMTGKHEISSIVLAPNSKFRHTKPESTENELLSTKESITAILVQKTKILNSVEAKIKNQIINTNLSLFCLLELHNNFLRIDNDRYKSITTTHHYKSICRFIREVSMLDPNVAQKIVMYSGAALAFYGITYTKDIDIIIFDMDRNQISKQIIPYLSRQSLELIDICMYDKDNEVFVKYTSPPAKRDRLVVHHNNKILKRLLSDPVLPQYTNYNDGMLRSANISRNNNILKGSSLIGGMHVFSLELLEQFYQIRFDKNEEGTRHYIILDMYLMQKYAKSSPFKVSSWPKIDEMVKFSRKYKEYEKIALEKDAIELVINDLLMISPLK